MSIFKNDTRSGYDEVVSYSPRYYKGFKEMNTNFIFAGWTLDLMAQALEYLVDEQFIMKCSEEMLWRLENFFGIKFDATKPIEERRNQVASIYLGYGKMSADKIISIIQIYFNTEVQVTFPADEVLIKFDANVNSVLIMDDIYRLLNQRMPAHLKYRLLPNLPLNSNIYWGGLLQDSEILNLRQVIA